jgi:effector-binding domain-containing protein
VSLVSPRGMEFFRQVSHADLRVRGTVGRVTALNLPGAELATTVHTGSHGDLDRTYGALATYVTQHELAVDGPVREYYLVDRHDTADESQWQTEIGWPVFQTR